MHHVYFLPSALVQTHWSRLHRHRPQCVEAPPSPLLLNGTTMGYSNLEWPLWKFECHHFFFSTECYRSEETISTYNRIEAILARLMPNRKANNVITLGLLIWCPRSLEFFVVYFAFRSPYQIKRRWPRSEARARARGEFIPWREGRWW